MGPPLLASLGCSLLLAGAVPGNDAPPPAPPPPLTVLHLTADLAVVAKPPSLPCHKLEVRSAGDGGRRRRTVAAGGAGGAEDPEDTVARRARSTFPDAASIHLVHRLDKSTSGCLLLAFSPAAAREAAEALAAGTKTYYALCRGDGKALRDRGRFVADGVVRDSRGISREAETEVEGLWGSAGPPRRCCLVRARPRTGRWHQVRQHLGRVHHPLVGETRHHKDIKENRAWAVVLEERGIAQRACLHCHRIEIPAMGEGGGVLAGGLDVSCPLPPDMREMVDLTDWACDARDALPALFGAYPEISSSQGV